MQLYKYVDISKSHNIEALKNSQLWFANPFTFNDPFDCNLDEVETYSEADAIVFLNRNTASNIEQTTIDFTVNNLCILREKALVRRSDNISKSGVLSLSNKCDVLLMWAHYANSHTGIALGFTPENDRSFFTHLLEVEYKEKYTPINYAGCTDVDIEINRLLTTKHIDWEYENEIRVIKTPPKIRANNYSRLFEYTKEALTDIYFGLKTTQQDIEKIQNICATHGFGQLRFHQAQKVHGEFKLNFSEMV